MATIQLESYGTLKKTVFWAVEIDSITVDEEVSLDLATVLVHRPVSDLEDAPGAVSGYNYRSLEIYNDTDNDEYYNGGSTVTYVAATTASNPSGADFYVNIVSTGDRVIDKDLVIKNISGATQNILLIVSSEQI